MHGLASYRRFGRARSLRSDRAGRELKELGPRGRVNLSPERGILLYRALCGVGLPRFLSCLFEDGPYSYRSSVTSFPYMRHFMSKTQRA
ncbi:hypothetical protein F2Q70_00012580 [Brassica cretica]|uniref:Uncharacterized protein n=1 Tax=Brassica cretica TaxID=69181 RepID=A0A8S9LVF6_BRACR|nr:hypothetical protein F2Q70_00012580 [Brassica cretica]